MRDQRTGRVYLTSAARRRRRRELMQDALKWGLILVAGGALVVVLGFLFGVLGGGW